MRWPGRCCLCSAPVVVPAREECAVRAACGLRQRRLHQRLNRLRRRLRPQIALHKFHVRWQLPVSSVQTKAQARGSARTRRWHPHVQNGVLRFALCCLAGELLGVRRCGAAGLAAIMCFAAGAGPQMQLVFGWCYRLQIVISAAGSDVLSMHAFAGWAPVARACDRTLGPCLCWLGCGHLHYRVAVLLLAQGRRGGGHACILVVARSEIFVDVHVRCGVPWLPDGHR